MKPTFGFLERRLKLGAKTRLMWQASIVPFLFGFSSPGLILDPWSRSLTMIRDPAYDCYIFLMIFFECTAHRSLILDVTRQSCSIFCHVLFNCIADAASLACLSISCTAGEQESHVMSEVEVQENKGGIWSFQSCSTIRIFVEENARKYFDVFN